MEKENITEEQYVKLLNMMESVDTICMYLHNLLASLCSDDVLGEEAEQLEGSDEKVEESCRIAAKVRFMSDVTDAEERSDLTAIQVRAVQCSVVQCRVV